MKTKRSIMEITWDKIPILTSRPPEMSQADYKLHQKAYKYLLKQYKSQGKFISGYEIDNSEEGSSLES